jgi:uncharacterized protein (TIGR00369 family)
MSDSPLPTPDQFAELMPFCAEIGVELVSGGPEQVVARLPWSPERCTAGGTLHGGALMALADAVGATVAFLNLPDGAMTTTIESKTNFLRGVTEGYVEATATPVHVGRRTIVVTTEMRNAAGKLAAITTQTQAVIT